MSKKSENPKFRPTGSNTAASHKRTRPAKGKFVSMPDAKTTKSSRILTLLAQTNGATLDELMNATSWQAHSVRGFISGTVRKLC